MPKRSYFSIPFELAEGFIIGVKGYVCTSLLQPVVYSPLSVTALLSSRKKGRTNISWTLVIGSRLLILEQHTLMKYLP
jgi:hypothetical protein